MSTALSSHLGTTLSTVFTSLSNAPTSHFSSSDSEVQASSQTGCKLQNLFPGEEPKAVTLSTEIRSLSRMILN